MSAIQHDDIRHLRITGNLASIWSPNQLRNYVRDNYAHQTIANYSACACGKETGHSCRGLDTDSCRFIRLGNGKYCLPEESPPICPIHGVVSTLGTNPFVIKYGLKVLDNLDVTPTKLDQTILDTTIPAHEIVSFETIDGKEDFVLIWKRYYTFSDAVKFSNSDPTIYMQCSKTGEILRIGKAELGLGNRYNAGYQSTIDAAMWQSGNTIYVTKHNANTVERLEAYLIVAIQPRLNKKGLTSPRPNIKVAHQNLEIENSHITWYSDNTSM